MIAPHNLRAPKNWQDFETLCLKLWGEIWMIPHEIEFNSDNSQGQDGVDIYGPIDGGTAYNAIQCKNKKLNLIDGSPNRISTNDIQTEIEKAKNFRPALKKLVIATSLPKDKSIEEFVRLQSLQHAQNGLFTIQICFWEFFERKITEFENVYNWYVKNEEFQRIKQLSVAFQGGGVEITCNPKYQKTVERYVVSSQNDQVTNLNHWTASFLDSKMMLAENSALFSGIWSRSKIDWVQRCWLNLSISNIGQSVIEEFKIELEFNGNFEKVGAEKGNILLNPNFYNNVKEYSNSETDLYIEPKKRILVQGDNFVTGSFYIQPKIAVECDVTIRWTLLSRDFTDCGTLLVKIIPQYYVVINIHEVSNPTEVRDEISYSLIARRGMYGIGGIDFHDNESDYPVQ